MSKAVLYLLLGYPGSGKTTTSKMIHEITGALHLWADRERRAKFRNPTYSHQETLELYDELNKRTDGLLAEGKSVIFDTNFNFYKDRQKLREIVKNRRAESRLIWVRTPRQVAKKRATEGSHTQVNRILGNMSTEDFDRMSNNLQPPRDDEPYTEIDGTKVTSEYVKKQLGL